jgi:hypothetical protein
VGEGIVTVEEQKRIMAALESRTRLRGDGVKHPVRASVHLLTGLLYCGIDGCGTRMSVSGKSYVCRGVRLGHACPGARAPAAPVERAVVESFIARVPPLPAGHPARKAMADRNVPFDRAGLTALWERSEVGSKRGLLSEVIERVWVARAEGRGRRFDPERRLRIVWAGEGRAEQGSTGCGWLDPWQSEHVSGPLN